MLPFLSQPAVAPACYVPRAPIEQSQLFNGSQTLTAAAALGGGTFACWIQRHALGAMTIVGGLAFDAADVLNGSTGKYRDLSGFSLVVANADGVYVDLVQVASGVASFGSVIGSGLKAAMAEVIFLSGDAHVLPTEFGALNIHGEPVPIATSFDAAEFGAKGFHLDFANPLAPGNDISGLGHHLTPTGFDATGKGTVASSPTNVYATLSSLNKGSAETISDGGLKATGGASHDAVLATMLIPEEDGFYAECIVGAASDVLVAVGFGIINAALPPSGYFEAGVAGHCSLYSSSSTAIRRFDGSYVSPGLSTWVVGDVLRCCVKGRDVWLGRNDVWFASNNSPTGNPAAGLSPTDQIPAGMRVVWVVDTYSCSAQLNFGQRPWAFAPPTGYKALCSDSLPEPDIKDPAEGYAAETAIGANILAVLDAATAHWDGEAYVEIIKRRDASEDWRVRFSDDPANAWATNNTNAKAAAPVPAAGGSYVGYRLRVGRKYGVYTAEVAHVTGTPTTVTHGLATARNAVIVTRVSAGGGDRFVFHPDMDAGKLAKLNSAAMAAADTTITAIGSSSFQITAAAPSGTYRVVVLAQRDGYLDLSKYTGGGDGSEAYAAMTVSPLLVISKPITGTAGGHSVMDAARSPSNPVSALLSLDNPAVEATGGSPADMLVGGLKLRPTVAALNVSGATYCTIAIGRPIGGVCVAPATAR